PASLRSRDVPAPGGAEAHGPRSRSAEPPPGPRTDAMPVPRRGTSFQLGASAPPNGERRTVGGLANPAPRDIRFGPRRRPAPRPSGGGKDAARQDGRSDAPGEGPRPSGRVLPRHARA